MKRLLILSATAGRGHVAAARALEAALARADADLRVRHEDMFDHAVLPARLLGRQGYDACVNWLPWLWKLVYEASRDGGPVRWPRPVALVLARRLLGLVASWRPDRILSTYWASGPLHRWMEQAAGRRIPHSVVITDADLHAAWLQPTVDRYYVADATIRDRLVRRSYPESRIIVSGIPAHPRFVPLDRREARLALGLAPDRPWLLVVAGPRAMRPLAARAADLRRAVPTAGVVVLTGRDDDLRRRLSESPAGGVDHLVVRGMVPDMERWLAASDLVATKGGGLITSEATAVGVPVLIHRPIPGQEEANAGRLEAEGAGRVIGDFDHLAELVGDLLGAGGAARLEAMTAAARGVGRPEAAATIAASELRLLSPARRRMRDTPRPETLS